VLQHGFALLHHEGSKGVMEGQKFFGCFVHIFLVYSFFSCLERLAPYTPYGFIQQNQQIITFIVRLLGRMQIHMHRQLLAWFMNFFLSLFFLGAMRSFFIGKLTIALVFPFLWTMW
jgi:hypothetical protein